MVPEKCRRLQAKRKSAFKRKYQDSYPSCGFIATGDREAPHPLCIIYSKQLVNKVMKPSKQPALKDKPLKYFGKTNVDLEDKSNFESHHFNNHDCLGSIILNCRPHC